MSEEVEYIDFVDESPEALMKYTIEATGGEYTCLRGPRSSGAIIIVDNGSGARFPVHGFVTPSLNLPSCKEDGKCIMEDGHCVRCLHAEVDAILAACHPNISLAGATIFSINKPCYNCTLHIIRAGIRKIYYAYVVYDDDMTREALEVAGVECIHVSVND